MVLQYYAKALINTAILSYGYAIQALQQHIEELEQKVSSSSELLVSKGATQQVTG